MAEEPIYKFEGLKKVLQNRGYMVEDAIGYRAIKPIDVDIETLNHIEFTDNGIFYIDPQYRMRQQMFLYKRDYHLALSTPKFHIRKCSTIQSFINRGVFNIEYRMANTESVMVRDMDDNFKDKEVRGLQLCYNCYMMLKNEKQVYLSNTTTKDFVKILRQAEDATENNNINIQEIDIFGYVKNWEEISLSYRTKKQFKCEKCGVKILNPFDYHYMHTHHKDGNKINNRESNLECLCIRCHANIDDNHRKRFKSNANGIILNDFNTKYPVRYIF